MRPNAYNASLEPDRTAVRRPPVYALIIISSLTPFGINSIIPSMPAIAEAFQSEYGRVQLALSLYLAAIAISQIFVGPLSDRFGRRPVLLVGFSIFVAVSVALPFAPNVDALIAGRVLQGASGCVGIVLGRAIVRDLFERRQAASMLGYVTMGLAVAPMVAPSIGGLLQETFGWPAIFWFTAFFGAVAIAVTVTRVPETNLAPAERLSFSSVFRDFWALLRDVDFNLFTVNIALTAGVFFAFMGGAPYVSERIRGLSPAVYGIWFGAAPVGYFCGNYISGRFTERFGVARMILAGSALVVVAAAIPTVLFLSGLGGPAALFLPMVLVGLASGLALPSGFSGAISVRPDIAGAASGLSGAAQIGAGAILSAAAGAAVAGASSAMPMFWLMLAASLLALVAAAFIYRRNRPVA